MKYRNTKTGTVIDVKSEVKGKNWEAVEPSNAKKDNAKADKTKAAGKGKKNANKTAKNGGNAGIAVSDPPQGKEGE